MNYHDKKNDAVGTGFENVLKREKKEFDGFKKEVSKMHKKLEKKIKTNNGNT